MLRSEHPVWLAMALVAATAVGAADLAEEAASYHRDFQTETEGIVLARVAGDSATFARAGNLRAGGAPVDADTLFEIGSITKVFTGILLADAVARGTASFDDSIAKHLPEGLLPPESPLRQVTLLDLATHTSGLPRLPANLEQGADPKDPYAHYSVERLYEYLARVKPSDLGKRETSYSNLGVGLLGHLLERIDGKPYEQLVRETIFEPLGMKSSFVQRKPGSIPASETKRFADGHAGGEKVPHWHLDALCGAGAIVSSARDLATFASAHFSPSIPEELRKALALAAQPQRGEVGLGWFIGESGIHHEGGTGGFRSELAVSPSSKTATVRLVNGTGPAATGESRGAFDAFAGFWQGTLDTGSAKLRLVLRVAESGRVVMHSLDQGGAGIPADRAVSEGGGFRVVFGAIGGRYEARREGDRLVGTWHQSGELPLTLERLAKIPAALEEALAKRFKGNPAALRGYWSGYLGGKTGLFVILEIDSSQGVNEARLYSPDQSPGPLPVTSLSFDGKQLSLESAAIQASYKATLGDDGRLDGDWKQGTVALPLDLVRSETMPKRE